MLGLEILLLHAKIRCEILSNFFYPLEFAPLYVGLDSVNTPRINVGIKELTKMATNDYTQSAKMQSQNQIPVDFPFLSLNCICG